MCVLQPFHPHADQLQRAVERGEYAEAARLLEAVQQLAAHFQAFGSVPKVLLLSPHDVHLYPCCVHLLQQALAGSIPCSFFYHVCDSICGTSASSRLQSLTSLPLVHARCVDCVSHTFWALHKSLPVKGRRSPVLNPPDRLHA